MGKRKGTALAVAEKQAMALAEPWELELAEEARDRRAKEQLGVPRVSHQGSILKIEDVAVKDNKLPVVIIDYAFTKAYYEGEYVPGKPQTPICYAIGKEEESMAPHAQAPEKFAEACRACRHNQFGTAEKGRGKRCKDERRLIIMAEVAKPTEVQKAEIRQIAVPPGSLKNWGNYLGALTEVTATGSPASVVTEISTAPGKKGAHVLTFRALNALAKDFVKSIVHKRKAIEAALLAPWPNIANEDEEQESPKQKKRKKKIE